MIDIMNGRVAESISARCTKGALNMDKLKQVIEQLKPIQMDGKTHPCPRCGRGSVSTRTALSRSADVLVCDQCGTDEALRAMVGNPLPLSAWNYSKALAELDVSHDGNPDWLWNTLLAHWGHRVSVAVYGDPNDPANVCLECDDCGEVVLDAELYTLKAKEDKKEWHAVTRWHVEDVIVAAKQQGVTLTEEQAARWWEKHEESFAEMLTQAENEMLAFENFEKETDPPLLGFKIEEIEKEKKL